MYLLPHHLLPLPSEEKFLCPNSWMSPTHTKAHVCMYETCLPYKADTTAVNPYAVCHLAIVQHASRDSIVAISLLVCPCPCLGAFSLSPMACHLMGVIVVFGWYFLAPPEVRHLSADHADSFLQLPVCIRNLRHHYASLSLVH